MGTEAVRIGNVRCGDIARDHRFLEIGCDVAPRVLEQRDQVVGGVAGKRVLEIEQAEIVAIGQHHQIVGMIIAQDEDGVALDDRQNVLPGRPPGARDSSSSSTFRRSAGAYHSVSRAASRLIAASS